MMTYFQDFSSTNIIANYWDGYLAAEKTESSFEQDKWIPAESSAHNIFRKALKEPTG